MMSNRPPHFVLVPFMAQGHMIPMVDMARLLAARGATISFITTPVNAARIQPIIDNITKARLPIHFISLTLPCNEVGLPEGSENLDLLLSIEHQKPFLNALALLREPLTQYLQNQHHPAPTCLISDYCQPWTMQVSQELNIPRFIFHGPCCFYMLGFHNITHHGIYDSITDVHEPFLLPDLLPYQFMVNRAQVPGFFGLPGWEDYRDTTAEAEATSDGVVINSFDELETVFIEKYRKALLKPVWPIGPFSLYNKDISSEAARGNKASIDEHLVLTWLDSMRKKSVIFVSFGSLVYTPPAQLMAIGSGLEASRYPFIWVLKQAVLTSETEKWLEGFEVRNAEKGLVINGWAPQVVILSHPVVRGFLTHCGWNSTLEAISAGVPMITWPHFGDQFLNEKLVVDVLRIGVTLGVTMPSRYGAENEEVMVTEGDVKEAVVKLMDGGEQAEERRERARELGEKAHKAMEEGGSSYKNMGSLIQHVSKIRKRSMAGGQP